MIAFHIGATVQGQDMFGANGDTKSATFAAILAKGEMDCHGSILLSSYSQGFFIYKCKGKTGETTRRAASDK